MEISEKDVLRFMSKVKFFEKDKCWEWSGVKVRDGYGRFRMKNKMLLAHRFSYLVAGGKLNKEIYVCHTCDNPGCVNPEHLYAGNQTYNMRDCAKKGRNNQQKKTHCPQGHSYSGENLRVYLNKTNDPARYCGECSRIRALERYYRNKK
jgi:hypothetical protein